MRINSVVPYAKSILILLGLIVLLGWVLQLPALVQVFPGMIGMVPNTALSFILLGIALSLSAETSLLQAILQKIMLLIILAIAVLSFAEEIYHYNLGIDNWLAVDWLRDPNPTPGRMSPNSSIAFSLSAITAFLIPYGEKKIIAIIVQFFTVLILFIAIISLLIYGMRWEFIFNWYRFARMATHTAAGFILVTIALGASWNQTLWYQTFYKGIEDKKIMLITGIILLFITMVAGLGGVAGLTDLNIRTVQKSLEDTLHNKVEDFTQTFESIEQQIDYAVKKLSSIALADKSNDIVPIINDLSYQGFSVVQLVNNEGEVLYENGTFAQNVLMSVPVTFPFKSSLFWQHGFGLKAKVPLYLEPAHTLQGYLIIEKMLPKLTKTYQNYENIGSTGELVFCYQLEENTTECFPTRTSPGKNIFPLVSDKGKLAVSYAFAGLSGTITTRDYRGDNVIATYSPVGTLDLGLVIKMNASEIYQPIRGQLKSLIPTVFLLICIGLFLLNWQVVPLVRKVISSENEALASKLKMIEANEQLTQRHKEIHLLGELSSSLQSCLNLQEAYALVTQYGQQLFPDLSVIFYLMHASHNYLERLLQWGQPQLTEKILKPDDCWALRRGSIHKLDNSQTGLICPHSKSLGASAPPSVCIPMLAQNELIGMLYIEWSTLSKLSWTNHNVEKLNLAVTFSEQISLSISNIKLRETLRNQSIRDKLTGLYNRRYLEETFDRELHRIERESSTLALFMIDVDHFKLFNDTFGHEAGDIVLQSLGQLFRKFIRGADISCRFGGEEFVLILPAISLENAMLRAQELHKLISQLHVSFNNTPLGPITLSIGIAMYPDHGETLEALIHHADLALYEAKRNGRNMTIVYGQQ